MCFLLLAITTIPQIAYSQSDSTVHKFTNDPLAVKEEVIYNPATNNYTIIKKIGDEVVGSDVKSFQEYWDERFKKSEDKYFKEKVESESFSEKKGLLPPMKVPGKAASIFGSNKIDIKPTGSAELIFGVNSSTIRNPAIPVRNQTNSNFKFDQKIQLNLVGKIGDKLKLTMQYNTESTFDFENQMKLEYAGDEDEIIKKIELGYVSMPLQTQLIQGSQTLFGVKSELQFGKLSVTAIATQQKGESKTVETQGGSQIRDFKIQADQYEANRHFFLSQFFANRYDTALANLPYINSPYQINRVEVWMTNVGNNNNEESRNIIGFMDIGEKNTFDPTLLIQPSISVPDNSINNLYAMAQADVQIKNFVNADASLQTWPYKDGVNYNKIENARKLKADEFTFNVQLGYISLNKSLNADEVLAVAFQYTVIGEDGVVHQVGEISTDGSTGKQALILKLLKSNKVNANYLPTWNLMMKNVYSLGESGIKPETFQMQILHTDPATNTDMNFLNEGVPHAQRWVELMHADQMNIQQDKIPDGYFDFIEGVTVRANTGRIYFPVREPFGKFLRNQISDPAVANKYCFDSLYTVSPIAAQTKFPSRNRFKFWVKFETSQSNVIYLGASNVPQGSVLVTAGGKTLVENQDYTVNYMAGQVTIINEGILNSATPVRVSLESNSLFAIQTKNLLGTHLDYKFSKDFNVGATIMNLTEKPLNYKVNLGDEPMSNTLWGLNTKYRTDLPLLTKWIDKMPLLSTKEMSNLDFTGEVAQFIPGTSSAIANNASGKGESYIDNFEGAETNTSLTVRSSWSLASVPQGQPTVYPEAYDTTRATNFNRAKLAWYNIDPLFTDNGSFTPDYLTKDKAQQNNNYVRPINQVEVFPKKTGQNGISPNLVTLDLAYYPLERGQYNFDTQGGIYSKGVNADGTLKSPETRWGGIMRKIETVDFEYSNIEFLEFWVMNPFEGGAQNDQDIFGGKQTGGDLVVHIGNLSEDVLKDSRKSFENGLPIDGTTMTDVDTTIWGFVPTKLNIVNAFDNDPTGRKNQDVGLDGLSDDREKVFFKDYLAYYNSTFGAIPASIDADPAGDNFKHYRNEDFNSTSSKVIERYKSFNGVHGNSPVDNSSSFVASATTIPDIEDINRDNTMNEGESYYEYHISMRPQDLEISDVSSGTNYLNNMIDGAGTPINSYGTTPTAKWIHFRIPIRQPEKAVGGIQDFRSMRFIRLMMKGWSDPVILRFARIDLVRETWRKYESALKSDCEFVAVDDNTKFSVTSINVEEDSQKEPIHYVPPVDRVTDLRTQSTLNEQALYLNVDNLDGCDSRAAYYNTNTDLRSYGCLKMFVHAETKGDPATDYNGNMTVFLRLGSDFDDNYYEYEIPLTFTDKGFKDYDDITAARAAIWPSQNSFDFNFSVLTNAKVERNGKIDLDPSTYFLNQRYKVSDGKNFVYVKGSPTLSQVKVMMIGVRNLGTPGQFRSLGVWVNELRLSCFNQSDGWAATATTNLKLADFGTVSLSGKMYTPGWGAITDKVSQRKREYYTSYDASGNFELGKLVPSKYHVTIPTYFGVSETFQNQEYNPLDQDVKMKDLDPVTRKKVADSTQTYQRRRSMNFSNVRKNRDPQSTKKPMPYDVENFDATYSFNEVFKSDVNTSYNVVQNYKGSMNYNFTHQPKNFQPFISSPIIGYYKKVRMESYEEKEKNLQERIAQENKIKAESAAVKKLEAELKELQENKAKFAKLASAAMQTPYLKLTREFNFFLVPARVAIKNDLNRLYSESMIRNNTGANLLIEPVFNKNFFWDRAYDVSWDLSKALKFKYTATNRARIDEPQGRIDSGWKKEIVLNNLKNFGRNTNFSQTFDVNYDLPLRKIPFTDWITANVKYTAKMDWQAAPLAFQSTGNNISNSNSKQLNSQFNFVNLYNKSKYLKKLNTEARKPKVENDSTKKSKLPDINLAEEAIKMLMMVKNVSINYTETNGTFLPGYDPTTDFFGFNKDQMSPGFQFATGQQQEDILQRASNAGWLTKKSDSLNTKFARNFTNNLNIKATVEPIKKLKIDITATRSFNRDSSLIYRIDKDGVVHDYSGMLTASYNITVVTIGSAFDFRTTAHSDPYDQFLNNRAVISSRLAANNPNSANLGTTGGFNNGYGKLQQEVLLYSFVSAYTGSNASFSKMEAFKKMPMPNWKVNYDGFMQMPWIKNNFQSFMVSHMYSSTMSQSVTHSQFFKGDAQGNSTDTTAAGFIPLYSVGLVTITEQLSPLIKVDATLKNSWIAKFELKKTRTISLNVVGTSVMEMSNFTIVTGTGYKIKDVKFPFPVMGKHPKSNLDLRADLSITSNKTALHKIDGSEQLTIGSRVIMLKTSADYVLSDKLNLRLFYEITLNKPYTSNSFPTSNSNGGLSLRYSL